MPGHRYRKNIQKRQSRNRDRAKCNKRSFAHEWYDEDIGETVIISKLSEAEQEERLIQRKTQEFVSKWSDWKSHDYSNNGRRRQKILLRFIKDNPISVEIALRDHQERIFGRDFFDFGRDDLRVNDIQSMRQMFVNLLAERVSTKSDLLVRVLNEFFHLITSEDGLLFFEEQCGLGALVERISKSDASLSSVEQVAKRVWRSRSNYEGEFDRFFDYVVSHRDVGEWHILADLRVPRFESMEFVSRCRNDEFARVFDTNLLSWCDDDLEILFGWSSSMDYSLLRFVDPSVIVMVLSYMTRTSDTYLPRDISNLILRAHGQAPLGFHVENATKMAILKEREWNWRSRFRATNFVAACFAMGGSRIYLEDDWSCQSAKELMFILEQLLRCESAATVARIVLASKEHFGKQFWELVEENSRVFREMQRLVRLPSDSMSSPPLEIRTKLCPEAFVAERFPEMYRALLDVCPDEKMCVSACDSDGQNLLFVATKVDDVREILRHVSWVFAEDGDGADVCEKMIGFVNTANCWGMTCVDVQRQKNMDKVANVLEKNEYWRPTRCECYADSVAVDSLWDQPRPKKKRRKSVKKWSKCAVEWKNIDKQMTKNRRLDVRRKRFGYAF